MKHSRPVFLVAAAVLLACIGLILVRAGSDRRAVLASTHARLIELRTQRFDPRDIDAMKRALAAAPDPQAGLLITSDAEATSHLEAFIRSIAQVHKAEIQSISLVADPMNGKLPAVRGSLHLIISDENIGFFVKSLETGPPAIFFERLRIAYRSPADVDNEGLMLDLTALILVYRDVPTVGRPGS